MPPTPLHALRPIMLLLAVGATTSLAQDEIHWENPVSGNWSCASCWNPIGPPLPIDAARIAVPGTYTVTLDSNASIEGLTIDNPDATLFMSGRVLSVVAALEDHGAYVLDGLVDMRNGSNIVTPGVVSLQGPNARLNLRGSSITAETIAASSGARIQALGGTSVLDAAFLSLTGGGVLDIANSNTVKLFVSTEVDGGGAGVIRINPGADLVVGDVILQDLTVEMNASNADIRGDSAANTLGVGLTTPATIRGQGSIRDIGLDNGQHGIIHADAGTLTIIRTRAAGFTNRGRLRASDGATLHVGDSAIDNTDGIIEALDNASVTLSNQPISITGGELHTEGSGVIRDTTSSGQVWLRDLAITGHYDLGASGHTNLQGVIEHSGTITVGQGTTLEAHGDVLTHGGGEIALAGNAKLQGADPTATLTNHDVLIRGSGNIHTFANLTNHSLITADDGGDLSISAISGAAITNLGTIRAENGSTLTLSDSAIDNTDGVIEALDASVVSLASQPLAITRGVLRTEGDGVITDATNSGSLSLTNLTIDGHYDLGASGFTKLRGAITNHGLITLNASPCVLEFNAGVILDGAGEILLAHPNCDFRGDGPDATLINNSNTIRGAGLISNFGSITNRGAIIADNADPLVVNPPDSGGLFDNQGQISVESPAGLNIQRGGFTTSGTVTIQPGALLQRSASADSDYHQTAGHTAVEGELRLAPGNTVHIDGGRLSGAGLVTANLDATAGSIEPGSSIGTLTLAGDAAFGPGTTLSIELNSTNTDALAVGGHVSAGGQLHVDADPNDPPQLSDVFVIITATSVSEQFDGVTGAGFPFNRVPFPLYEPDRVLVRVVRGCAGDWNDDNTLNTLDFIAYLNDWGARVPAADLNNDGAINTQDFLHFLNAWNTGC